MTTDQLITYLQRQSEHGPERFSEFKRAIRVLSNRIGDLPGDARGVLARTLLSECLDYLGEYDKARAVLMPYTNTVAMRRLLETDRKHYARVSLRIAIVEYRRFEFAQSQVLIERSIEAYQQSSDHFGHALALFHAAKIAYRQSTSDQARAFLDKSIQILTERTPQKGNYRKALSRILLGWYSLRSGRLAEAGSNIAEASVELKKCDDLVNLARIYDIRGQIHSACGPEEWPDAVSALTKSARLFRKAGHRTYRVRTLNYLGRAYTRMRRFKSASSVLREASRTTSEDPRSDVENQCLRARLYFETGDLKRAQTTIDKVLEASVPKGYRRLHAEALITKAQTLLAYPADPGRLMSALDLLTKADLVNRAQDMIANQAIDVAINLLMAQVHCRQTPCEAIVAERKLATARASLTVVKDYSLETLAKVVAQEIRQVDDSFHIRAHADEPLSYKAFEQELRFWLVRQAINRVKAKDPSASPRRRGTGVDRQEISLELGMTRQNLELWLESWRDRQKPLRNVSEASLRAVLAEFNISTRER